MSKETFSVGREQAILAVLLSYADLMAYSVAQSTVNGIKWDSDYNGGYWAHFAQTQEQEFARRVKEVGGPHVNYVMKHFAQLTARHISNLSPKEEV